MQPALDFDALIAHLYIVGGRAVNALPPGALAEPAPRRAARARQAETLFVLAVPNGPVRVQADYYQRLARQAAETYFKTAGGITSGLREMLQALNQTVLSEQKTRMQPVRVGLLCAVLRETELYLVRCGPMQAFFWDGVAFQSFPATRTPEGLALAPALGVGMEPRVELTRFDLRAGALLLLGDESWQRATDEALRQALTAGADISQVLEPLRGLAQGDLVHGAVLQFVTETTPTPETAPQPVPETARVPTEAPAPEDTSPDEDTARPSVRHRVAQGLTTVAARSNRVWDRLFPEEPDTDDTPSHDAPEATDDDDIPDAPALTPDDKAPEPRNVLVANLVVLVALIIPLVVGVVVVGLALSDTDNTAYEACRLDVLQFRDTARDTNPPPGAPLDDQHATQARQRWQLVLDEALRCEDERPGDEDMLRIAGEAQNNLDRFDRVTRRVLTALRRFEEGAQLRGPVSGNWLMLYTLDRAADAVYQDVLSDDGNTLVEVREQPILFQGQNIAFETVAELVDIEWMLRGGLPAGGTNVPLALDETGLLVWYSETFSEASAFRLVTPGAWSRPVALALWRLNMYVLDPGAGQIWRYVPNEGVYSDAPEEYFTGDNRPDLSTAVDFGIDEEGAVYILFADGDLRKYLGGAQAPFDLFNLPAGAMRAGDSLYVDNNPLARELVVTDATSQTVYTMSWGGTVNTGYRPLNLFNAFRDLSGAISNPDGGHYYALAGNTLYHFSR